MDERRLELKVGLLLAVALAGCVGLLYLLGSFGWTRGSRILVDFGHSGSVPEGAPVKLAGVRVGRVTALRLLPDRRDAAGAPLPVQMELEIQQAVFAKLPADSTAVVATQGPLGEPFIEISPGSAAAAPLRAGAVLRGVDPPRMDLLSAKLYAFLDASTRLMGSEHDLGRLVESASSFVRKAELLLDENGPIVTDASRDFAASVRELRTLVGEGGRGRQAFDDLAAVASQLKRDLPQITEPAQRAAQGAAAMAGGLTSEDAARARAALVRLEQAGASLNQMTERADRILARMESGEGTLGALAKDPELYQDLKALVTDLKRHPWKVFWKD